MAAEMESSVDPTTLYTKQECIGGGSFGKVYKGLCRRTGRTVAIKVIDVENAEDEVEDIMGEIMILSNMNSPFVTKYYGSYLHGSDLWIVMEFCGGGSCADLMKPGPLAEVEIAIMLKELLLGLTYLHDDHKLHRDIKGTSHSPLPRLCLHLANTSQPPTSSSPPMARSSSRTLASLASSPPP